MAAGMIGKGLLIRGELYGEEDLVIEGTVEGTISMEKSLTIEVEGKNKITIHDGAKIVGDIKAPRIELDDGAYYKGTIQMG